MSIIHDSLEPGVIDNAMILKAMDEQGPKGEAGRLAKEEGRSMEEVDKIRLEFLNILKIDHLWIMTSLVKLQLGNNIIEKIENLEMLVNLRELDLSFNNIEKIENLEALVKLEILLLFENRISVIENITTLTKMMIFSIGNNRIDSWDNVIYLRQFSALRSLNMAGNPCAEKLNFRSYVCAFLPNLTYYEYKMITLTERNDACQEYSSSLEKLEDQEAKETQEKEEKEKAKKELEYHMEAYVEGLNTDELFITMFKDDKEGLALLEMNDDAKDLQKIFHEQMMEVIEQLFSIGLRQHKVREEEMTLFIACVNKAKEENRLNSQHLMEEFLVKKAGVFHNIHELAKTVEDQNEEDLSRQIDEMQKHTDSYHEFCQKTWYDLMEAELTLFEQLEETNGNFERNLNDLVGSFIEQAQSLFTHIRNLEQNFSEQLNECATHYLTNLNVRLEDRNLNVPLELIPMQEVRKVSEEKALDVVCLQEPYSTRNGIILQMPKEARIISNGKEPMNVTIVLNRHITVDNINLKVKELTWALQAAMRKAIPVMKEVTRLYHQALLVSIVEYGAGVWAQLRGDRAKRKLRGPQKKILMRLSGAYKTIPTNALCVTLGVWPLDLEVQKRTTGYWLRKGKDVDRRSYLDEIADGVSKTERDRHMDELVERRQRKAQDCRQNRQEETTEEEVTSEYD
uniref:Dynein axonemal assembly factor 1 homolog n=1 Tax=Timema poppense TaxID=170557 RepID=A0A7R9GV81_TIMPO|nr:unnamed protein product [Timema poppensis]